MEELRQFCLSPRQEEIIDLLCQGVSKRQIGIRLNIDERQVYRAVQAVKSRAASQGFDPENNLTHPVGLTQTLKGASTLYDGDGNMRLQWVKSTANQEAAKKAIEAAAESMLDGIKPLAPIKSSRKTLDKDLLTLYTLTDFHVGMMATNTEGEDNWDLNIARRVMLCAMEDMANGSPNSETAILNLQGDWLHFDSVLPVTPKHQHVLDASGRFHEIVDLSLKMTIDAINALALKHKKVVVIVCEGNHDISSSIWLKKSLGKVWEANKSIQIDQTNFPYMAYQHGNIMLAFHHGHKTKNKDLPGLFASEPRYRKMWGDCTYSYIHTGHYHHTEQDMAETGGAIVERHPTLAARDSYTVSGGFVSMRAAKAITYHKTLGEVARITVRPREQ
jgi:hypothetical protein